MPFFPLGGFSPLQSEALSAVAARLETTPMSIALSDEDLAELDKIGR